MIPKTCERCSGAFRVYPFHARQRFCSVECAMPPRKDRIGDLFVAEPNSGCWLWLGSINRSTGYGHLGDESAHRIVYEIERGPIPAGLTLDHLCRVRCCVNPTHLEPVTHRVNCLRGVGVSARNAKKTHCAKGHEYTPDNTYFHRSTANNPQRVCRQCVKAKTARDKERKQLMARIARTVLVKDPS